MGYESDTTTTSTSGAPSFGAAQHGLPKARPQRPCDNCRKRKSRCEMSDNDTQCVLCQFHGKPCTFLSDPPKKKRRVSEGIVETTRVPLSTSRVVQEPPSESAVEIRRRDHPTVKDYADLRGPSLLKKTLGLQNHRHSSLVGPTSVYEPHLLGLPAFRPGEDITVGPKALRKVSTTETFVLEPDTGTRNHDQETDDLDAIEAVVSPHGPQLIALYFRIVHPTFPILHKRVFLEKYDRTYREFSPPLLAAVYILTLNWWSYSAELSLLPKPNEHRLEEIAFKTMSDIVHRPKLSTIQAGLLLLQCPDIGNHSWALISQLVGVGQDLGLHLDCTSWRIPQWEKGLRKRLAWALYMQDKWGSLVHGRPSHITAADWGVRAVEAADFPESAADEDDEEGSTEVEKGRVLFCEMIALARILADVLREFYSVAAEAEVRANAAAGVSWVLRRAKPLQLRLKSWFAELPECLRLQDVGVRKLSSTGYLHLAYYAAEITLHRRIVAALGRADVESPGLARVCRLAARERLVNALDFVNTLRPEHLQSFWYSASTYNFALIGTFISLLWVTSAGPEDAAFYRQKLEEYRWSLRLASKGSEVLERAIALLSASTGVLVKAVPVSAGGALLSSARAAQGFEEVQDSEEGYGMSEDAAMMSPGFDESGDEGAVVIQPLDQEHIMPWLGDPFDHVGNGAQPYLGYDKL